MSLEEKFWRLAHALQPLGFEVDTAVLTLWIDREAHGRNPLPETAVQELADAVEILRRGEK